LVSSSPTRQQLNVRLDAADLERLKAAAQRDWMLSGSLARCQRALIGRGRKFHPLKRGPFGWPVNSLWYQRLLFG
jgi:hypothetical protein